jgi:hypothetical protein
MFKTRNELVDWINDYLKNNGKKALHRAISNSKNIKDAIIKFTEFLPEDTKFNQRCYHLINDLNEIPCCKECKLNKVNFNNRDKEWRYLDFCSPRCGRINKNTISKFKETHIKKFGADNISKTEYFIQLIKKINNERYGVDWYQQSDDFKSKSKEACLKKYGFSSYTKTEEFRNKIRNTIFERYGVDWYSKSLEFRQKFILKSLEKYGTEHPMLNEDFKKKVSKTIKEKYGKDWYNQTNEFKEYCFKMNEAKYGNPVARFKCKDYKLPSGKSIKVQGYEHYALNILLKKYKEEELSISYSDIREEVGIINYFMDEKEKIYLPDIYIIPDNKIIEVKSIYTYNLSLEQNLLKKEACISCGLLFEFWIIDNKGKLLEIK